MPASDSDSAAITPPPPVVPPEHCPIATTLGTLGRKWTLTILRDVAFFPGTTFSAIRRSNPGLRQRTLSLRLKQLQAEGLIERANGGERTSGYRLTSKGLDVWPILAALFDYGILNHASVVFSDGRPRTLAEVYPGSSPLLTGRLGTYARTDPGNPSPPAPHGRASAVTDDGDARPTRRR
jgi:DNA-binding HxlR family transcriptional regulator